MRKDFENRLRFAKLLPRVYGPLFESRCISIGVGLFWLLVFLPKRPIYTETACERKARIQPIYLQYDTVNIKQV